MFLWHHQRNLQATLFALDVSMRAVVKLMIIHVLPQDHLLARLVLALNHLVDALLDMPLARFESELGVAAAFRVVAAQGQFHDHVLDEGDHLLDGVAEGPLAADGAVPVHLQPLVDAVPAEDVVARGLDWVAEDGVADAAHELFVGWGLERVHLVRPDGWRHLGTKSGNYAQKILK